MIPRNNYKITPRKHVTPSQAAFNYAQNQNLAH